MNRRRLKRRGGRTLGKGERLGPHAHERAASHELAARCELTVEHLEPQLRALFLQNITDAIANSGVPFLDLARSQSAFADALKTHLGPQFEGLVVPSKIYGIMAAGRPVIFIGPPDSEAAHLVRKVACGFVIVPGDVRGAVQAHLSYYRDPAQLEEHGYAARAYFERHCDRPIATQRFWQVLQQI